MSVKSNWGKIRIYFLTLVLAVLAVFSFKKNEQIRSIASLYQESNDENKDLLENKVKQVIVLNCEKMKNGDLIQGQPVQVLLFKKVSKQTQMLMIKFDKCSEQKFRGFKVKNKKNGYEAEIFKSNKKIVSTDFMQLDSGDNTFLIQYSLKPEQKFIQELKIYH